MAKRDCRYEFIRVVSMVLVVGVHALAVVPGTNAVEKLAEHIFSTVFFFCNGLFFMLSGKFALSADCEQVSDYRKYYFKRFASIGFPALFFMLLRTMHNAGWWPAYLLSPELRSDYLHNVLSGFRSCEYWFLYPLTGLLVAAPFLGKFLRRASREELLVFLGLGIGYNALRVYLSDFSWDYPLGGWMVLFVLGYALERIVSTPRQENYVILLGLGCFCLTVIQKWLGNAPGADDLAPAYVGMVSGAFLLLKRLYRPGEKMDMLVTFLGKQSLAVYMLHMLFLPEILSRISVGSFWVRLPLLIVLTTAVALCAAWLLNATVIALLQKITWKLMGFLGMNMRKVS